MTSFTEQQTSLLAEVAELVQDMDAQKTDLDGKIQAAIDGATAQQRWVYVDPFNGVDARNGDTWASAVLTLDRAIELTANNLSARIILAGNVELKSRHFTVANAIHFVALDTNNSPVNVTISFLPEALNSPNYTGASQIAGLETDGELALTSERVTFNLPYSTATIGSVFSGGLSCRLLMHSGGLTTANVATTAGLLTSWGGEIALWANATTIDANSPGHIVTGVAAGTDPNIFPNVQSNLTTV